MFTVLSGKKWVMPKPDTRTYDEKLGRPVLDSNSQYIVMLHEAFLVNNDVNWLKTHVAQVERAIAFYDEFASTGSSLQ